MKVDIVTLNKNKTKKVAFHTFSSIEIKVDIMTWLMAY